MCHNPWGCPDSWAGNPSDLLIATWGLAGARALGLGVISTRLAVSTTGKHEVTRKNAQRGRTGGPGLERELWGVPALRDR